MDVLVNAFWKPCEQKAGKKPTTTTKCPVGQSNNDRFYKKMPFNFYAE